MDTVLMEQYASNIAPGQKVREMRPPRSWNTYSFWTFNKSHKFACFLCTKAATAFSMSSTLSHRNSVCLSGGSVKNGAS